MKQITIVTENSDGMLAKVAKIMADCDINIESLDAESVREQGVINLTVDRYREALHALRDAGLPAVGEETLLIRIPDEPGALARISERFRNAGVPLRSVRIIRRNGGFGLVALSAPRTDAALELVRDVLVS
ncbi:MAG: hypothetical protein AAF517_01135 [Planctomycetota bacterium]